MKGNAEVKLDRKDIYQAIDKEIMWCLEHPDKALSAEYRKGFTNGLIQAKYLIQQLAEILKNGESY